MVKLAPKLRAVAAVWRGPLRHRILVGALAMLVTTGGVVTGLALTYGKPSSANAAVTKDLSLQQTRLSPEQQALMQLTQPAEDAEQAVGADAEKLNAALPFSSAPVLAARGFVLAGNGRDKATALDCMTQAVYYEAGFEPIEGQRAVAQVILNRMRHPAFPKTVCGVIYQGAPARTGCQFSFVCDGSLGRAPAAGAWRQARQVAQEALDGKVMSAVGHATHYHANYVLPRWAPKLVKVKQIGAHIFYRWPGGWGEPGSFRGQYAGGELPLIGGLPDAAIETAVVAQPETKPAEPPRDPTDHRADNDIGGRLNVAAGWSLFIPGPADIPSSASSVAQAQADAATASIVSPSEPGA